MACVKWVDWDKLLVKGAGVLVVVGTVDVLNS